MRNTRRQNLVKSGKQSLELNPEFSWVMGPPLKKRLQICTRYLSFSSGIALNFVQDYGKSHFMSRNTKYAQYSIGEFSYGKPIVLKFASEGVLKVGKFCSFGPGVVILLAAAGGHRPDWITTYPFIHLFKSFKNLSFPPVEKCDVTIGNDVWVGANSVIMSGVKIGDGVVIGASSIVTKDVPPYSIFAGNPAKLIRMRFDPKTIKSLLEIKWWDWKIQRIKDNMAFLLSSNVEDFISKNSNSANKS